MNPDFWPACGYTLLQRNPQGWLQPTPAWLGAWLARPELALVPESCRAETRLHQALAADPLRPVPAAELAALKDADARENYGHFLALRDALLQAGTLEAWLLGLWRSGSIRVPPIFIDVVVQAVVRGLLEGGDDAFEARAAEMFFRTQRLSVQDGRQLAGDKETLDLQRETHGFGDLGRLLAQAAQPLKAAQLQVLQAGAEHDNRAAYWAEAAKPAGRHIFLLDLTHEIKQELGHGLAFHLTNAHSGLKALSAMLARWVRHFLGVAVRITPLQKIDDAQWRWHLGLDAEASRLMDDLYEGREVAPERLARLVSLFRLDFEHPRDMHPDVAGKPVYLGLMATAEQTLRLKPQNLLLNLPLAPAGA
ncbi:DUF6352 family protein [Rubrivivax rivuli]|uniref:Uncharacterized protein n=1 Tax=Rubrivivax rivuli TaxID=1862385 RepID=A0A437RES9_9BURK|nr:DUF6352 family protein [Rubrivivax rivuli]RVU45270.1 hypothetical protein EOE66_14100 [Rubrivivax rivuli]